MAVTENDLAEYIGVDVDRQGPDEYGEAVTAVASALDTAREILTDVLSEAYRPVPEAVRDRLLLEVGHAFYKRGDSPSGASQSIEFGTGQAVQGPKDPLTQVWPIIRRYVLPL